jgi:hypothetical protein
MAQEEIFSHISGVWLGPQQGNAPEPRLTRINRGGQGMVGTGGTEGHHLLCPGADRFRQQEFQFADFVSAVCFAGKVIPFDIQTADSQCRAQTG